MNGTITLITGVWKEGKSAPVMQAKVGDRVTGNRVNDIWTVSKLVRNGSTSPLPYPVTILASAILPDDVIPPVDPPTTVTLTHTIKVYSDGSIDVDGNPFP